MQLQEKLAALKFKGKVLEADYEAQKAIAPFLKNKVLKKVVQTFANDRDGDFEKWAKNPRVIEMLKAAEKHMEEGRMTEEEMEEFWIRMLKDPNNESHEEFMAKTKQVARLPTDQLVEALNEHLMERRKGNDAYTKKNYGEALKHYQRAKAVVDVVEGLSQADQIEVILNKVLVNCNIAAVRLARKEFGAAVEACDSALELDPECEKALARRAKAHIGRHEFKKAQADIDELRKVNYFSEDIQEIELLMKRTQVADRKSEKTFAANLFSS